MEDKTIKEVSKLVDSLPIWKKYNTVINDYSI
jgi:hypothetical protein